MPACHLPLTPPDPTTNCAAQLLALALLATHYLLLTTYYLLLTTYLELGEELLLLRELAAARQHLE